MDDYAQIAKSWTGGRKELLEQPRPVSCSAPGVRLGAVQGNATEVPAKMENAAQLKHALQATREEFLPYLQNLAPSLPCLRQTQCLREFRWRKHADAQWKNVSIPHYEGPLGAASTVYETEFTLDALSDNQAAFVVLNGADYKAQVYVNGRLAGCHEGFFASFEFDITPLVQTGANTLRIELQNDYVMKGNRSEDDAVAYCGDKIYAATGPGYDDPQFGWHHCPPGMGLLDTVNIEVRPNVFIHTAFARTLENEIEFWMEAYSCSYAERNVSFLLSVYGQNCAQTIVRDLHIVPCTGKELGLGDTYSEVLAKREGTLHKQLPLSCMKGRNLYKVRVPAGEMKWWSPEEPWLYQLQLKLLDETETVIDTFSSQFGRRTFTQDTVGEPKGMFYLNGNPIRLRGANTMGFEQLDVMRGDFEQLTDDILLAKLCNMNFLRITQRPVQQAVYDFCDRLGLMVQTDFPLFGCLRRQQFCEAVRQAEEMERHIRAHACCVLVSYINEPFPNANNHPNVNVERTELEQFFQAADIVVHLNHPDRVIKHVDGDYDPPSDKMPDNHCYPMWYNGHGIDIGLLHKGYWLPVKPNWYYGCGEFGCEGLESAALMREAYPAAWLPADGEPPEQWSPQRIIGAQTSDFYHFFYHRPSSLEDWVAESQSFQALATTMMTEAFRRDDRMISFAIHLFIDAFPAGWMKTIMDCKRNPKPAFFAYKNALEPLLVSLRTDKTCYFAGETASVEGWLCNDTALSGEFTLCYELLCGSEAIRRAQHSITTAGGHAQCVGTAEFELPQVTARTEFVLRAILKDGDRCMAWNELTYTVFPPCGSLPELLLRSPLTVTDDDLQETANGKLLWIDKPAPGDYTVGQFAYSVRESGMAPMHFAASDTGHPWVTGFAQQDFRHWYDAETDRITPLADCTVLADGFRTVLQSRNLRNGGAWAEEALVCETSFGKGRIILSQIAYRQMLDNPAGRILLSRVSES